ncbi:MAG TPA: 1,4-alpha-glucan branching protein domain-containing protein [Pyrinomonadaceae bacterium]
MPAGYFSLILHAHLPFVRHPEYPEFLEEDWLYEAITEVYLPLIFIFQSLHEAGAAPRLAMNVSPPLCEMLADPLLQDRYTHHLENLIELARKEEHRTRKEAAEFHDVAKMYVDNLTESLGLWNDRYNRNLLNAFRELQDEGVIEIITCCATHGFLPLISTEQARRAQIQIAVANYKKHFGRQPRGIWLAECAYEPGIDLLLKEAGIEYFISDTHAILYGDPRPRYGVHAPVVTPNGIAVFARDVETSQQVWSAEIGYPGNAIYREFYRDIGWDAPLDYLKPHLHEDAARRHLGLKYHRITGRDSPQNKKEPYIPALARDQAAADALDFITERIAQAHELRETFEGHPPLVVSPYDAELYGHWWYEGPQFLDFFYKKIHFDQDAIACISPGDFLDTGMPIQVQQPTASSWGENGYYKVWLNEKNSWMYPHQHDAERRMTELADRGGDDRLLNQLARELLLAESSDWAFQIYQGTTVQYSTRRFESHIQRFNMIADMLQGPAREQGRNATAAELSPEQEELLTEIERRDNIFPEIDWRVYCS